VAVRRRCRRIDVHSADWIDRGVCRLRVLLMRLSGTGADWFGVEAGWLVCESVGAPVGAEPVAVAVVCA
jgi:hypothetical protein